jgi:hypothetical protein
MAGWSIVYRSAGNNSGGADVHLLTLAAPLMIPANGYLLFVGTAYAGTLTPDGMWTTGGLAGGGGAVGLRDNAGALVDSVSYNTLTTANNLTETAPAPNPPAMQSIARHPNGHDSNNNSTDFVISTAPTPRAANP